MSLVPPITAVLAILAITPGLLFHFDVTPKVTILLLGVAVVLIPAARPRSRWVTILLAAQFASLAFSTIFSTDPALSIGGTNWRRMGLISHGALLLFALIAAARPQSLQLLSVAGIAVALYGCAQYAGWDPILPSAGYHVGEDWWKIVRPPSTLGHAAYAATFYLHATFVGLALAASSTGLWRRIGFTTAAICSVAIVLSGTRAAMLGWCVGFALLFFALRPKLRAAHFGLAAVVVAMGAMFYFSPYGLKLRSRTRWYTEDSRGGARLWLWRDSARMGAERWLTGWGPEVFPAEFPRHQSEELSRAYPDFYHESPHNVLLEAWTAQGLPGLAVIIALAVFALRGIRRSPFLSSGVAAALIAQQFTSFTVATALCFYWNLAMIDDGAEPAQPRLPIYATVPVAALLVWYAVSLTIADRLQLSTSRLLAARQIPEAIETYDSARAWQPPGRNTDLWFSRALLNAAKGSSPPAEAAAIRASLHAEDRANAAYSLAALQSTMGDAGKVEASLRLAVRTAPNWYKPHWALAKLLMLSGRRPEAETEIERAVALGGTVHPEVEQTRLEIRSKR